VVDGYHSCHRHGYVRVTSVTVLATTNRQTYLHAALVYEIYGQIGKRKGMYRVPAHQMAQITQSGGLPR
jgi:hypothetical protein